MLQVHFYDVFLYRGITELNIRSTSCKSVTNFKEIKHTFQR